MRRKRKKLKQTKITHRTSSITGAFVKAIIPHAELSDHEIEDALIAVGINPRECAYCGKARSDWDHLHSTTSKKRPSGYFHVMGNIVPSCGTCNQSKSGRNWKEWINGDALNAPRGPGKNKRIALLEAFANRFPVKKLSERDLIEAVGAQEWDAYWRKCSDIEEKLREAQLAADSIRLKLKGKIQV